MLQIATGRFFGDGERFPSNQSADLFGLAPIGDLALKGKVSLLRHMSEGRTLSYKLHFNNGLPIPLGGPRPGTVYAVGASEVVDQFIWLLTVATERIHAKDAEFVLRIRNMRRWPLPELVREDEVNGEATHKFLANALDLPRAKYLQVIAAAKALNEAIRAAEFNYDAAFAHAIFAIESLVPENNGALRWEEYPKNTRDSLDAALNQAPSDIAETVRGILLADDTLKAMARFLQFVEGNLTATYFDRPDAVPRSHLRHVLGNAYSTRSAYVHDLDSTNIPLPFGFQYPLLWRDGHPHLTLQGATTIAFELIQRFTHQGPHLPEESGVRWRDDLPGIVKMRPSYEYWLHKPKVYTKDTVRQRFADVAEHILNEFLSQEPKLLPLEPAIKEASGLLLQSPKDVRPTILALVALWGMVYGENIPPWIRDFLSTHRALIDEHTPEIAVVHVLQTQTLPWSGADADQMWTKYIKARYGQKPKNLLLNHNLEVAVRAAIANIHLAAGDVPRFQKVAGEIADECSSRPNVRAYVLNAHTTGSALDVLKLLGVQQDPNE